MKYYNTLTTPSGKKCKLYEIQNDDYISLLKFINATDYEGFYNGLDELISESINDFESYNLFDKAYVYVAFFYYSVKESLTLNSKKSNEEIVSLVTLLDEIEKVYKNETQLLSIKNLIFEINVPRRLKLEDNNIFVDYYSGLSKVNGIDVEATDKCEKLLESMPYEFLGPIYDTAKKISDVKMNLFVGTTLEESFRGITLDSLFYIIVNIFNDSLTNFYSMFYILIHYGRLSYTDILKFTPVELQIYYNNFIEDKEKQNTSNKVNMNDPNVNDSLMGL